MNSHANSSGLRKDDSIMFRDDNRLRGGFLSARCHPQRLSLWRHHAVWRALQLFPLHIKLSSWRKRGPRDKKSLPPISVSQQHQPPPLAHLEPRWKAPNISPSPLSARGPRLRKDDSLIGTGASLTHRKRHGSATHLFVLYPFPVILAKARTSGQEISGANIGLPTDISHPPPLARLEPRGRRPISAPRSILPEVLAFARMTV
ncbi:hypothetical protein ANOBCDAF_04555 [Pleomorphomonas sp. T1.2MG-36]|nr:hypothetical protein ANOBCDAF_04555 [Pleomorphomonas sp. T1.2MG-36]